jgi:MFS family permease
MGFSIGEAQYLSAPPYVLACIVMFGLAWIGDRYHIRGPLLLVNCALGLIGAPLLGWADNVGARYFGTFLICASAQGGIPTCSKLQFHQNPVQIREPEASVLLSNFCSATYH